MKIPDRHTFARARFYDSHGQVAVPYSINYWWQRGRRGGGVEGTIFLYNSQTKTFSWQIERKMPNDVMQPVGRVVVSPSLVQRWRYLGTHFDVTGSQWELDDGP